MAKQTSAPSYICWHENDFMGDRAVIRMTPHQQLMYRSLCIVARFCETRPYLPDEDNELWLLADADSLEHWKANREAVLVKFHKEIVAGKPMLSQRRVVTDHEAYQQWLNQKSRAGKASANSRQRALNGLSTGVQQSSESIESCEKVKSNAVLSEQQNEEPLHTTVGLVQNSLPHNRTTPELPTRREIMELLGSPIALCDLFEKQILATNPRRSAQGKKEAALRPDHWKKTWLPDFQRLLDSGYTMVELEKMINLAFGKRWLNFTFRPKNIVENHDKLATDLKIPVRDLIPEMTAYEKRAAKAKAISERAQDKLHENSEDEFGTPDGYTDCPECGTCHDSPTEALCYSCKEKQNIASPNEFARIAGATRVVQ